MSLRKIMYSGRAFQVLWKLFANYKPDQYHGCHLHNEIQSVESNKKVKLYEQPLICKINIFNVQFCLSNLSLPSNKSK